MPESRFPLPVDFFKPPSLSYNKKAEFVALGRELLDIAGLTDPKDKGRLRNSENATPQVDFPRSSKDFDPADANVRRHSSGATSECVAEGIRLASASATIVAGVSEPRRARSFSFQDEKVEGDLDLGAARAPRLSNDRTRLSGGSSVRSSDLAAEQRRLSSSGLPEIGVVRGGDIEPQGAFGAPEWQWIGDRNGITMFQGNRKDRSQLPENLQGVIDTKVITKANATIDEITRLLITDSTSEFRHYGRKVEPGFIDGTVLHTLIPRSKNHPHRYMGIKWMAVSSSWPIHRPRDFCFLEYIDTCKDLSGGDVLFRVIRSIEVPECPPLEQTYGLVRGQIHYMSSVFSMASKGGVMKATISSSIDFRGDSRWMMPRFSIQRQAQLIQRMIEVMEIDRLKHLDFVDVHHWMPNGFSRGCRICDRLFSPLYRRYHHCRSCGELVCGNCSYRYNADLPVVGQRRVRLCSRCVCASRNQPFGVAKEDGLRLSENASGRGRRRSTAMAHSTQRTGSSRTGRSRRRASDNSMDLYRSKSAQPKRRPSNVPMSQRWSDEAMSIDIPLDIHNSSLSRSRGSQRGSPYSSTRIFDAGEDVSRSYYMRSAPQPPLVYEDPQRGGSVFVDLNKLIYTNKRGGDDRSYAHGYDKATPDSFNSSAADLENISESSSAYYLSTTACFDRASVASIEDGEHVKNTQRVEMAFEDSKEVKNVGDEENKRDAHHEAEARQERPAKRSSSTMFYGSAAESPELIDNGGQQKGSVSDSETKTTSSTRDLAREYFGTVEDAASPCESAPSPPGLRTEQRSSDRPTSQISPRSDSEPRESEQRYSTGGWRPTTSARYSMSGGFSNNMRASMGSNANLSEAAKRASATITATATAMKEMQLLTSRLSLQTVKQMCEGPSKRNLRYSGSYARVAQKVVATGSFCNFRTDPDFGAVELNKNELTGDWEGQVMLKPGRYSYKLYIDGHLWTVDDSTPDIPAVEDEQGGISSELVVPPSA